MKKLFFLLVMLLATQTFTSCDKSELDEQKQENVNIQAGDYGGDDDIDNDNGTDH